MSQEISEKFEVNGPAVVRVDNVSGSVTVRPGPEGEVSVHAVNRRKNGDWPVEIGQKEDGSIYVRAESRRKEFRFLGFGDTPKVDFTVTMPASGELTVRSVNAGVDVSGISGHVDLKTVNGAIRVSEVGGDLKLKTVNGEISGARLRGTAELATVNGGISLREADLPALSANTVSGDMHLETPMGAGPYNLKTVSGDAHIAGGGEVHAHVRVSAVSGSVRLNGEKLPSGGYGPGIKKTFVLGEGGPEIIFKSVSGNLAIEGADMAAFYPAAAAAKAASPAGTGEEPDFMGLLDRISRGEISVDEGIASLKE